MNPLVLIALQQAPAVINFLKNAYKKTNPNQPEPTDEQVILAYNIAFESSLKKDDLWLAAHPKINID